MNENFGLFAKPSRDSRQKTCLVLTCFSMDKGHSVVGSLDCSLTRLEEVEEKISKLDADDMLYIVLTSVQWTLVEGPLFEWASQWTRRSGGPSGLSETCSGTDFELADTFATAGEGALKDLLVGCGGMSCHFAESSEP